MRHIAIYQDGRLFRRRRTRNVELPGATFGVWLVDFSTCPLPGSKSATPRGESETPTREEKLIVGCPPPLQALGCSLADKWWFQGTLPKLSLGQNRDKIILSLGHREVVSGRNKLSPGRNHVVSGTQRSWLRGRQQTNKLSPGSKGDNLFVSRRQHCCLLSHLKTAFLSLSCSRNNFFVSCLPRRQLFCAQETTWLCCPGDNLFLLETTTCSGPGETTFLSR